MAIFQKYCVIPYFNLESPMPSLFQLFQTNEVLLQRKEGNLENMAQFANQS